MTPGARWPVSTARFFKAKKPVFQFGIFARLVSPEQLMAMLRLVLNIRLEAAAKKKASMGGLFLE
jgi:hypothetical protein